MRTLRCTLAAGILGVWASSLSAVPSILTLENDELAVTIDSRNASIAAVTRKRSANGAQPLPIKPADILGLRIPIGSWNDHTVTSGQSQVFKVEGHNATELTLATTGFTSDAGTFAVSLRIHYRLEGSNLVTQLRIRNLSSSTVDGITFPAIGAEPARDGNETVSTAEGVRPLGQMFSANRIRRHHSPFERLDPEDMRGWFYDDPAFSAKAFHYPSQIHTAWIYYSGGDFGIGLDSRDRSFQSQFGVVGRTLLRDSNTVSANRRSYQLSWRWLPLIAPGATWESPDIVVKFDGGDWHGIARQHREWLATWVTRPNVAPLLRESLGWLSRPVSNFDQIPALARQGVEAGAPYIIIYGWYGSGMYGLSYDFYPQATLGGVESLRRNLRKARELGACSIAWYNGTGTSEVTREHREHARDWVVLNRYGGITVDGRWTVFDPNRPPTSEDGSTLMNLDMGTAAAAFNTDNVRRIIQDYGFCGLEMDQGYKNYPSYRQDGGSRQPELRYSEGVKNFYVAARDLVKTADPNGIVVGEGYSDLMNQYVDSTWIFDGGSYAIMHPRLEDSPRYALPWITQSAGILEPDAGYANRAFMMNAPFDIFLNLTEHSNFVEHLRKLRNLKRAVGGRLYDWDFSSTDGFTLQTSTQAVEARSYIAKDKRIAVVVVNTGNQPQSGVLGLTENRGAATLHRLGQSPTSLPAGQPINLDLAPFDVGVIVAAEVTP